MRVSRSVRVLIVAFASVAILAALGKVRADDAAAGSTDYTKVAPTDLVKQAPKGKIKDPYSDTQADIVAAGRDPVPQL